MLEDSWSVMLLPNPIRWIHLGGEGRHGFGRNQGSVERKACDLDQSPLGWDRRVLVRVDELRRSAAEGMAGVTAGEERRKGRKGRKVNNARSS